MLGVGMLSIPYALNEVSLGSPPGINFGVLSADFVMVMHVLDMCSCFLRAAGQR